MKKGYLLCLLTSSLVLSGCSLFPMINITIGNDTSSSSLPDSSSDSSSSSSISSSSSSSISSSSSSSSSSEESLEKVTTKYRYTDLTANNVYRIDSAPSLGNLNLLVIPVWLTDSNKYLSTTQKQTVKEDIETTYFGTTEETGWQSVKTYYETLSHNKISISGVVTDWYTPSYSINDVGTMEASGTSELVKSAVGWYQTTYGVSDLSNFDNDNDGYLDGVMLIYAAPDYRASNNASHSNLWAYCYWVQETNYNKENPIPNAFFWASYDFMYGSNKGFTYYGGDTSHCNIDAHTYIHEMGHIFGLSDYYDYSSQYNPAGGFSMQDYNVGSHDAFSALALGWAEAYIPTTSTTITIKNFQSSGEVILLNNSGSDSTFDEYLLLELYTPTGLNSFDTTYQYSGRYPKGATKTGIRLWHVDARLTSLTSSGFSTKLTNKIVSGNRYSEAMSNTYYKEDESANSYISPLGKEYADYNILQLISRFNVGNYRPTRHLENTSLFTDGHSFSMNTYSNQFKNGAKLNSGQSLGWEFTVNSVSNESATISVKKI